MQLLVQTNGGRALGSRNQSPLCAIEQIPEVLSVTIHAQSRGAATPAPR
jgi:hypothetical protein